MNLTTFSPHLKLVLDGVPNQELVRDQYDDQEVALPPFYKLPMTKVPKEFDGAIRMNSFGVAMVLQASLLFLPRQSLRVVTSTFANKDGLYWCGIKVPRLVGVILVSRYADLTENFKIRKNTPGGGGLAAETKTRMSVAAKDEVSGRAREEDKKSRGINFVVYNDKPEEINQELVFDASGLGTASHITAGYFEKEQVHEFAKLFMDEASKTDCDLGYMLELEYNPAASPELGDKEGIDHIMDVTESKRSSGLLPHHPTLKGLVSRTVQILNMKQRMRNTPRFQTKDAVFKTNLHLTMDGEKRKLPPPVLTPLYTTMFPEAVREFVRESLELRDEIQKMENDAVQRARDWKAGKFNTGVWASPEPLLPPVIEVGSVKLTASPAALKEESEEMDLSAGLTVDAVMAEGGGLAAKTSTTADDRVAEGGGLAAATDTAVENELQGAVDV
ncbi:MAG: hypothetical protein GY768_21215, partial [Planctomycetaceae bacterium]|nr:hypothetical protein [Planctomycetaceae bacterium]